MPRLLCWLVFLAGLTIQDPDYEALVVRLRLSDPEDRERAAAKLASAGEKVLPLLETAIGKSKDREVLARLEQVKARIRLRLHTPALDEAFSASFRRATPDLIKRLRNPTPEILLEALEASTGYKVELDPLRGCHVAVAGNKIPEATKSDTILIHRITLCVLPPGEQSVEWKPVKAALAPTAHLFKTAALLEDSLIHLEDHDVEFRRVMFQLSETGQRRRFLPAYVKLLDSPHADVEQHAASKLSLMNPGDLAPAIAAKLRDSGGMIRRNLLEALARTGDPRWKAVILQHAEDPDPTVQEGAVRSLALLDPAAAAPHLLRMLDAKESQLLQAGIMAAGGNPDPRVSQALERIVLKSSNELTANQAVYSLVLCNPKNVAEVLEQAMKHSSPAVRNAAAVTASMIGGDAIIRALESLLDDPAPNVRGHAASSLGHLKVKGHEMKSRRLLDFGPEENDPAYLPFLLDLLEGPNEPAALEYLMRFRCPGPCRDIQDLVIKWPTDRNPTVKEVLQAAAIALKTKGIALKVEIAVVDEKPRIRSNSAKMVMGLLYWLIPSSLGQEYGWYMEEGNLSLLPIDEARRSWREWAEKGAPKK